MLELEGIIDFVKHIGAELPLDDEIDVKKIAIPLSFKTNFEPFRHRIYAVLLCTYQSNNGWENVEKEKASVFFKVPYQITTVEHLSGGVTGYFVGFTEAFLLNHKALASLIFDLPFLRLGNAEPLTPNTQEAQLLESIYLQILNEYHSAKADRLAMIVTYLQTLLLQVQRVYNRLCPAKLQEEIHGTQNDLAIAGKFKFMLNACFKELEDNHVSRTVAHYAGKLAVHPNQLNAAVKRATGKTAHGLLQEQIILFAKDLLLKTNLSIKEIAYQLSFNAPPHFVSFFKKYTLHTPSQFRLISKT